MIHVSEVRVLISQKHEASRLGKPYKPLPESTGLRQIKTQILPGHQGERRQSSEFKLAKNTRQAGWESPISRSQRAPKMPRSKVWKRRIDTR